MSKVNLFYVRKSNEVLFFQQSLHNNIMGSMGTTSASDSMQYRVPKCDVIENEICEIMGFVKIFWKNNV